jgi:hypothetical protein
MLAVTAAAATTPTTTAVAACRIIPRAEGFKRVSQAKNESNLIRYSRFVQTRYNNGIFKLTTATVVVAAVAAAAPTPTAA